MNKITKYYLEQQKKSNLQVDDFIKTITNEEHKMYIQWSLLRRYAI
jgi:hypothetical protein